MILNYNKRNRQIANTIIEGPRAIFPHGMDNGWLEQNIGIFVRDYKNNQQQHFSLWVDATMNKDDNFFKPVIRLVNWNEAKAITDTRNNIVTNWPDITIELGYIKSEKFELLNQAFIELQQLIPKIYFAPFGINLNRDTPDLNVRLPVIDYAIKIVNFSQSIKFYSSYLNNDEFSSKVMEFTSLMVSCFDKIDNFGWKERYDAAFDMNSFDWDYTPIIFE